MGGMGWMQPWAGAMCEQPTAWAGYRSHGADEKRLVVPNRKVAQDRSLECHRNFGQ
jgi:hypothetical protein